MISDTTARKAFSPEIPGLQFAFDSVSLGLLKECPRKYRYTIIKGSDSAQESVHLTFGLHYHKAIEIYDHRLAANATHDDALDTQWIIACDPQSSGSPLAPGAPGIPPIQTRTGQLCYVQLSGILNSSKMIPPIRFCLTAGSLPWSLASVRDSNEGLGSKSYALRTPGQTC